MPKIVEWTSDIENSVITDIESGLSLRATAENNRISKALILKKVKESDSFRDRYAHAKEIQLESMADEILTIADSASSEDYNVARLQVDSRKWLLSKLVPKKYGEKVEQYISGPDGGPIQAAVTVEFVKPKASE